VKEEVFMATIVYRVAPGVRMKVTVPTPKGGLTLPAPKPEKAREIRKNAA